MFEVSQKVKYTNQLSTDWGNLKWVMEGGRELQVSTMSLWQDAETLIVAGMYFFLLYLLLTHTPKHTQNFVLSFPLLYFI